MEPTDVKPVEEPLVVETPLPVETQTPEKKKPKKSRKIPKAKGHPKYPKNGYVRFCDETRLQICTQNPSMDPVEVTKVVAAKWHALSVEEKQPFNDSAKIDQLRFKLEMKEFEKKQQELGEGVDKVPKKKKKKSKGKVEEVTKLVELQAEVIPKKKEDEVPKAFINANCELPIFTDAFLEHNKQIESELKQLRKSNVEIEQQNSVLMKHIENMDNGVIKVEGEIVATKQQNAQLEKYLTKLKCILASGLNSVPLPGLKTGASVENIAEYMQELTADTTAQKSPTAVNKATAILRKIEIR